MKTSTQVILGVCASLTTITLSGCGATQNTTQGKTQVLNWMENSALPTMDISKAVDVVSAETLNNTGEGLLRMGNKNTLNPGVAKSYTKSTDGKIYTFNLRKSNWSNGSPVTARDFVYSWQRTVNPKTASEYAYLFSDIKNATQISNGKKPLTSLGVRADGNYKLIVKLTHPVSYFTDLVSGSMFSPQNKTIIEKYGQNCASNATDNVYNGPFKLTNWSGTSDNWTISKNYKYWSFKTGQTN